MEAEALARRFHSEDAEVADQLRNASGSILLNIGEGYGRWHKRDKVQFYRYALGSTNECAAALDRAVIRGLLSAKDFDRLCADLEKLAQMLQGLIRAVLSRRDSQ
jgi:four helix bundle protein